MVGTTVIDLRVNRERHAGKTFQYIFQQAGFGVDAHQDQFSFATRKMRMRRQTVGQTLIDSSMAIGLNEKTLDFWESQGLKFSETDSPLALFYVVAISLDSVEPSPKSIHVFDFHNTTTRICRQAFFWSTLRQDSVAQIRSARRRWRFEARFVASSEPSLAPSTALR